MHFFCLLSIVLGFAATAVASVAAPGRHLSSASKSIKIAQEAGVIIHDFLISKVYTFTALQSVNGSSNSSSLSSQSNSPNTTIHFVFKDLNSNTSTVCTDSWADLDVNATAPFSYVACNPTNVTEFFQWKFVSYSGLDSFQIMFAHIFEDPLDYPPPFDVVEYFSSPTNFTLSCSNATGVGRCRLPRSLSPVHAAVAGISN